jgi:hypothetical protein
MKAAWIRAFPKQARKLARPIRLAQNRRRNRPKEPRKRIRGRSKRMMKLMAYYRMRRLEFLSDHPYCQCHHKPCYASQVHHSRGRNGTLLLDERFWMALCSAAHDLVKEQPETARRIGLLAKRGEWNVAPQDAQTEQLRQLMIELTR